MHKLSIAFYMRVILALGLCMALLIAACAGGFSNPSTPGGWGSAETNTVVAGSVEFPAQGADLCASGMLTAQATISTATINAALPANTLFLEQYKVEFTALDTGAPAISATTRPYTVTLPTDALTLVLMTDSQRMSFKRDLWRMASDAQQSGAPYDGGSGPFAYAVKVTFSGRDLYGSSFGTVAQGVMSLAKQEGCVTLVQPQSLSLTAYANPDNQPSDDVTVRIITGEGPFHVYSSHNDIVASPGELPDGTLSFDVDPQGVSAPTQVTISIVGAGGSTSMLTLSLMPQGTVSDGVEVGGDVGSPLAIAPAGLSLVAQRNPEQNPRDDVRFHITGGQSPYTVYSDNEQVVSAPGQLTQGAFSVDPDAVPQDTVVTLTVVDALGASTQAVLTVRPLAGQQEETALSISPARVSVVASDNPDADATDDVPFLIYGGTPPYTITSGAPQLVASPGLLYPDQSTFSIDPDAPASRVDVPLTVRDSMGRTVEAVVELSSVQAQGDALTVMPSEIRLAGVANPDLTMADDVTFHITGGTGPFKVYSTVEYAIAPPGVLGSGVRAFSIDPNEVPRDMLVVLTVVDRTGQSAQVNVTLTRLVP